MSKSRIVTFVLVTNVHHPIISRQERSNNRIAGGFGSAGEKGVPESPRHHSRSSNKRRGWLMAGIELCENSVLGNVQFCTVSSGQLSPDSGGQPLFNLC